jgi:transposase
MKRIIIPDAEIFIAAIQDEISRTWEGRYFHRLHVVLHVLRGDSSYEAARFYGHSPRTIQYWVHRLLSDGLAGLWDRDHPGRPSQLSQSEQKKLRNEIRRSPRELAYDQNLWDGPLLSHHLEEHYGITLSIRQCQRLFHQLGFTLQRPRREAHEADPLQQEKFKKTSTDG